MKISELSQLTQCPIETIRYYEKEGLITEVPRHPHNNYRFYTQEHLEQLLFIRRCRHLKISQDDTRQLLNARTNHEQSCCSINQLIDKHLGDLKIRLQELNHLVDELYELRKKCNDIHPANECGIMQQLKDNKTIDQRLN